MNKLQRVIKSELTWDRLDLAFELFYLDLINKNKKIAEETYAEHNRVQLDLLIDDIKPENIRFDYKFYKERSVDEKILDNVVTKFIEYASDTYIAFLWPAGKGFEDEVHSMFRKIVYKKDIKLTPAGAFNLLYELYKPREWLDDKFNKYKGTHIKLVEYFPDFGEFTIIVFQSKSLEEVIKLKARVRLFCDIKNNSIHTTDNREEALRAARLLLNENGRHFLNYSKMAEFEFFSKEIELIKNFIWKNQLDKREIVLDSDATLALYGIKEFGNANYSYGNQEDLIYDPSYYFYYSGVKFISFKKVYDMRINRKGERDRRYIKLMNSLIENTAVNYKTVKLRQRIIYMKTMLKFQLIDIMTDIFKKIGLYKKGQVVYHKIKNK